MLIYLNMAIPVIAILLMILFFGKKFQLWEYAIIFAIPLIGIIIAKSVSINNQTRDEEILNYYFVSAKYTEFYQTYVHQTCTRCVRYDSTGCVQEETYDCSYCDDHPPHWEATDNLGKIHSISENKYNELVLLWNNESKIELNRNINYHFGCGVDGDAFITKIKNDSLKYIVPFIKKHVYENRVQCSDNIFNFQEIDSSDKRLYGLYEYPPENTFNYNPILGVNNLEASKRLSKWNGKLGLHKRCHLLICVFKNKSNIAATKQESYWKGGNKNEVVLCIGVDNDNKISWTYVFSWTDNQLLKIELRDEILAMNNFDLIKIVDHFGNKVSKSKGWIKKSFKEFSYINVEPTHTTIIITFIITLILTVVLCVYGINNRFEDER